MLAEAARGESTTRTPSTYFAFIDGLRALAVIAVIAYHFNAHLLPGGFTGVDVFFVISGFVVSGSVADLDHRRVTGFAARFYARRLRRILPALVVCLVVTELLSVLLIPTSSLNSGSDHVGMMAFVAQSNRALVASADSYFAPHADFNPFTHTWSLGVEEQFYLLFPLVFLAWLRGGRWRRVSIIATATSLFVTLFHTRTLTMHGHETLAFYSITARLWQIAAGVLLYQFVARGGRDRAAGVVQRRWRGAVLATSCVLLAFAFVHARPAHTPWPDGLAAVGGTIGIIACLVDHRWSNVVTNVLSARPLVAIGRISYSLYLWHWPVIVLFRWTVGLAPASHTLIALVLTAGLAVASFRWVESPIRRSRTLSRQSPWLVITAGLVFLAGGIAVARMVVTHKTSLSLTAVARHPAEWSPEDIALASPQPQCGLQDRQQRSGATTVRLIDRVACVQATTAATLFVAGDSHAGAYSGMLKQFALTTGAPVRLMTNPGCAFGVSNVVCVANDAAVVTYIVANAHAGDLLFMPSLRLARLSDQWATADPNAIRAATAATRAMGVDVEERTRDLLAPIVGRGVKLLFEAPLPLFASPPYRCADEYDRHNPICAPGFSMPRRLLVSYRAPVLAAMEHLSQSLSDASIWDPFLVLCPGAICHAVEGGRALFFDGDHLSGAGNVALGPSFLRAATALAATRPGG